MDLHVKVKKSFYELVPGDIIKEISVISDVDPTHRYVAFKTHWLTISKNVFDLDVPYIAVETAEVFSVITHQTMTIELRLSLDTYTLVIRGKNWISEHRCLNDSVIEFVLG